MRYNKIETTEPTAMNENNDYIFEFETNEEMSEKRYFVVICYDIFNTKRRNKFAKFLERYALRVQRSVFEGELSKSKYKSLTSKIGGYIEPEDNVRVYRISGNGEVKVWGKNDVTKIDEVIII